MAGWSPEQDRTFTRPYRPQTNGKAERMVRTLLGEWAYARPFRDTAERISLLPVFLDFYNRAPPHVSPMRGVTAI